MKEVVPADKDSTKETIYFDKNSGVLIEGQGEYALYLESAAEPDSIVPLNTLLRDPNPIENRFIPSRSETRSITKDDCAKYGRWLLKVLEPPEDSNQKLINTGVLKRAWELGLGPGPWTLSTHFGSVSEFYSYLKIEESHRIGLYDDWDLNDYVRYFKSVGDEIGARPSLKLLKQKYKQNPYKNPNPVTFYKRYDDIGGLNKIAELAGYTVVDLWDDQDYVEWGVKFMLANNGLPPSVRHIGYLSKKKVGPSVFPIGKRFGSVVNFREIAVESYKERVKDMHEKRQSDLNAIAYGLEKGTLPYEVFEGASSEDEMLVRYARQIVLDDLLPDNFKVSKLSIATMNNPSVQEGGLIRSIRKLNNAITGGDIESSALYLGVFDYLWPNPIDYMEQLKIPDDLRKPKNLHNQYKNQLEVIEI